MLIIDNLSVRYGNLTAVDGVSLQVPPGKCTALTGLNGAGKSSLLKGIFNMVADVSGTVSYRGECLSGLETREIIRMGIGYVAERKHLFASLSVRENLELAVRGGDTKTILREIYDLYPQLAEHAARKAGALSGGMRQMLALGRCLAGRPDLLVLDEPSTGLAPCMVAQMYGLLARLKAAGYSLLLAEQNILAAEELADQVCYLDLGRQVDARTWSGQFSGA